jgi:hypothetical protein
MKRRRGRPYFFKKLIQFSLGNIALDLPPSNIDAFLTGETGLAPLTWMEHEGSASLPYSSKPTVDLSQMVKLKARIPNKRFEA